MAELEDDEHSASYLRGANLISRTTNTTEYYTFNAHGDVVNLTNASGVSVKSYDYNAFGNEKDRVGSDPNPFRYCGEYFDVESGAYYLRARYYDPSIGRFTQEDPACAGLNWYTYCNNSPIRFIDPTGFVPMCADEDIIKEPTPAPKPTTAERKRAHDEQKAHAIYEEQMAELTLAETEDMKKSEAGKQMLKDFELSEGYAPYLFTEEGIYPYWVGDGGITIGYGHYISEADVINDPSEKALYDTYTPGARIDVILGPVLLLIQ